MACGPIVGTFKSTYIRCIRLRIVLSNECLQITKTPISNFQSQSLFIAKVIGVQVKMIMYIRPSHVKECSGANMTSHFHQILVILIMKVLLIIEMKMIINK